MRTSAHTRRESDHSGRDLITAFLTNSVITDITAGLGIRGVFEELGIQDLEAVVAVLESFQRPLSQIGLFNYQRHRSVDANGLGDLPLSSALLSHSLPPYFRTSVSVPFDMHRYKIQLS